MNLTNAVDGNLDHMNLAAPRGGQHTVPGSTVPSVAGRGERAIADRQPSRRPLWGMGGRARPARLADCPRHDSQVRPGTVCCPLLGVDAAREAR
jgi:hypothetical protein